MSNNFRKALAKIDGVAKSARSVPRVPPSPRGSGRRAFPIFCGVVKIDGTAKSGCGTCSEVFNPLCISPSLGGEEERLIVHCQADPNATVGWNSLPKTGEGSGGVDVEEPLFAGA